MLGHLAYILEKHSRGVCGPGFDFRECIHTFSLESKCCHPFWCFKNRPGVIRPVDSTFGCNCAPQWLTSVSPGCCGRLLRNKEPIFITLLWFYLNIQLYFKPILEEQFRFYNTFSRRLYSNTIHYVQKQQIWEICFPKSFFINIFFHQYWFIFTQVQALTTLD